MQELEPFCHWCETNHQAEREADGKYCPGPLLQPDPSWDRKQHMYLVSLHESVKPALTPVFYGIAQDAKGDNWSVCVQLVDQTVKPDVWGAKIQFLMPEAEQALGAEFDIWNGSRQHGRCIAEVRRIVSGL